MRVPALLVLILGVGCGDATGTSTTAADGGAASSSSDASASSGEPACKSGLAQTDPACEACQDERCCVTATAAADEPGTWTQSAAKICREASCFDACGVPEPTCGGIVLDPASCTEAVREKCCAELTACAENDACVAIIYLCIDDQGCAPNKPCFDDCLMKYADGASLFDAADKCLSTVACT